MTKMTKRMLIMVGAVLLLVVLLGGGFALHIQKLVAASPRPGPQTVTAARVEALEWQPQVGAIGTMVAVRGVDVTTEIAGLVRSIEFKSGQEVKAGTVLVQLNADSDIAQLRSLQAAADLSATTLARDKEQLAVEAIARPRSTPTRPISRAGGRWWRSNRRRSPRRPSSRPSAGAWASRP